MKPVVLAIGVSHRDVELASLWLRWVNFLGTIHSNAAERLMIVHTKKATPRMPAMLASLRGTHYGEFNTRVVACPDECEDGYPKSASHLFLRTLEAVEKDFPGSAVFWCEADTVPMKPTWFAEIAAEYAACEKPFLGMRVGTKFPHLSGNAIYPANWREVAPTIANVLKAPDYKLWGPGKGQPWDVYCRKETTPQMAESKLMFQEWKDRDARGTRLSDIPEGTCLFHQDKAGALIREIARTRFPDFMSNLREPRKFYFMNGHPSRLRVKGARIRFTFSKWSVAGHRSAVCSDELEDEEAASIAALVGQLGVREITEEEFLTITGRDSKSLPEPRVRALRNPPAPPEEIVAPSVFVMLGRYGDICNILPMLKADADAGRRPTLVVAQDFADILDGVSYVDRIVWDGAYDRLADALRWLRKEKGITAPVVCQYHQNPIDKGRLTDSYQKEVWRLAGRLDQFESRGPLEFDKRDSGREENLVSTVAPNRERLVLVGLESASSPLKNGEAILSEIRKLFEGTHTIIDLATIRAKRVYDLIALIDAADVLITADTVFLHLARVSYAPVIALLNDGWRGSVPHYGVTTIRYAEVTPGKVANAAYSTVFSKDVVQKTLFGGPVKNEPVPLADFRTEIYHAVDPFGEETRHKMAQETWRRAYTAGVTPAHFKLVPRTAASALGDPRKLPFLKDILWNAIPDDSTERGGDIVLFTNGDIALKDGIADVIREHISKHHIASMRRTESNAKGHPGRDLFAFTVDWLLEHWEEIPDYVVGAPVFDLGLVALIRKFHGLPFSLKSCKDDMAPADMTPGWALHLSHDPEWQVSNMDSVPSVAHNKRVLREWAAKYTPEIKFSPGGNLK